MGDGEFGDSFRARDDETPIVPITRDVAKPRNLPADGRKNQGGAHHLGSSGEIDADFSGRDSLPEKFPEDAVEMGITGVQIVLLTRLVKRPNLQLHRFASHVGVRSGRRQSVRRPSPLIALQPVNVPPNPLSAWK